MHDSLIAAEQFTLPGRIEAVTPHGSGNVNDTFLVRCQADGATHLFILQRLNPAVFADPATIMANLRTLSDHVRPRLPLPDGCRWELPEIIPCHDGNDYWQDQDGSAWRTLSFIEHTQSFDAVTGPDLAREAGRAMGIFHALTHDLPPERLHDPLPGFHVTPCSLAHYDRVAAIPAHMEQNEEERLCQGFIAERRQGMGILEEAHQRGAIRTRVIHGDPKLANILFATTTGQAVSLIDLDTVKPGLVLYDLGDCLRSCCNLGGEETPPEAVRFDAACFAAILEGYLPWAAGFLDEADRGLIVDAAWLISLELGMRFFTDHLEGDVYFKTKEPGHNLQRARSQFALCHSIETQMVELRELAARIG